MYNIAYKAYRTKKLNRLHEMINISAWIWNHCVALQRRYYSLYGAYISKGKMQHHIAKLRKRNKEWTRLNSQSVQEIVERVDCGYQRFFKKIAIRPPKFKKAKNFKSFVFKQSGWRVYDNRLIINKVGSYKFVKSRNYADISRVVVRRNVMGDIFFIFTCRGSLIKFKRVGNATIGLDFGLKTFLTCSNGEEIHSPQYLKQCGKKIRAAQSNYSKKKEDSKNRKKAQLENQRLWQGIVNKRREFEWKMSHYLCRNNKFIAIEDLNIRTMYLMWGNKISDLSPASFITTLQEVAKKYDTIIQKVGRFYPSSKTCGCGEVNKELKLSDRIWTCPVCGAVNQRDLLASNNILSEGIRLYRTKHKTDFSGLGLKVEFCQ